ncbi:MAG: tRNA 4-thiouridine(8) synthase ThiI [Coprobacillus sp.]|nr:tRNA 4-thiouridine(8) synthase ThiI [Coprobacillus sp.]
MNKYDLIMIRFGELSTKGKNKKEFISLLFDNVRNALKEFSSLTYERRYDHIYIHLEGEDIDRVVDTLKEIPGIHSISLVKRVDSDIELIKKAALDLIKDEEGYTFKVTCKRANKEFPIHSDEVIRSVATVILKNTNLKVDVHNPDILLSIEIRDEGTYLFFKTIPCMGGYPLGVGGKALLMLSGGIDSPVAAYLLIRKGVRIECVHFASPPYTSEGVIIKLVDILTKLNKYQSEIRLHIVPFTAIQECIYKNIPEPYCITEMRRYMYKIADKLARKRKCLVIANGESIGQVASQTLASLKTINEVTSFPIIRPLAVLDKEEIIRLAGKIGTYEISIRPFEDCCTIFAPKNPKTAPKLDEIKKFEEKLELDELIEEALKNIDTRVIK